MWGNQTDEFLEGDTAPDFQMPATDGRTVSLEGYKGKPLYAVLLSEGRYSWLHQASLRLPGSHPDLKEIGLDVIGVSPDKIKPIEKFAAKYGLLFPLGLG